jgi:hypothetical protein
MTGKEPIQERLENLGRAIGSGESIVDDVMSRIEVSSVTEPDRRKKSKAELIAGRFIMSRFTKLAAAAVIIIAVLLSIAIFERSVRPAYGISDVPGLLCSARTLHVKAWSYFPEDAAPGKVQRRVALESWYDLENGLSRGMSAGYNNVPENTTLRLNESVCDGQYIMGINHSEKTVTFHKLSPFQQKLHFGNHRW